MDVMGNEKAIADKKLAEETRKREELEKENMERLLQEQQELRDQIEKNKTYKVKMRNPEKEARKQRR